MGASSFHHLHQEQATHTVINVLSRWGPLSTLFIIALSWAQAQCGTQEMPPSQSNAENTTERRDVISLISNTLAATSA